MNSGQTIIALLAMALLMSIMVVLNRSFQQTDSDLTKSELDINAVSLANSIVKEATGKAFDQRLMTAAPPNYPTTGLLEVVSWKE